MASREQTRSPRKGAAGKQRVAAKITREPAKLGTYKAKRNFGVSPEPAESTAAPGRRLVIQHHFARRDHYDLRLEVDGVLASWAVTRGPSANPHDKRLAVHVEDHPIDYATFEGLIPKGEYGGGTVILWEFTTYTPDNGDPAEGIRKGEIKFTAHGERMRGRWALVRMKTKEKRENWLLIKERDEFAETDDSLTARFPDSVSTRRARAEIEAGAKPRVAAAAPKKARGGATPPAFVAPQLCGAAEKPPEGDGWLFEMKYDGYRLELATGGGDARLYTRSGLDWTGKFAPIAKDAQQLVCKSALIDGEAVVMNAAGISDFPGLVSALEANRASDIVYVAFDLLSIDGEDLRERPLIERKAQLEKLIPPGLAHIRYAEHVEGRGQEIFERSVAAGAEGVVAKLRTSPYVSRRSPAWLKIKGYPRTDVVIIGFRPSDKREGFASLQAAVEEPDGYRYVGGVGTGFSEATRNKIFARVDAGVAAQPFAPLKGETPRDIRYIRQPIRAEIQFGGWTGDGHLRQARFLALREDLPIRERETRMPAPTARARTDPAGKIAVTHAERVVYPKDGVTKGEIVAYYDAIADRMAPYLARRPVSIVRAPETIDDTFFQRHPLKGMKAGVIEVEADGETYMALDGAVGLRSAAQFGAIELHGWMSRIDALDAPDRMVFDLDPDPSVDFAEVKRAAREIADHLADLGLETWPLLSGGKGVHIVAPLDGSRPYSETELFAKGFATALAEREPARFVATMSKQRRVGRIFVDWLRNKKTATAILPWSLRARAGACVAVPVSWKKLTTAKAASQYSIKTAAKLDDPWDGFFSKKQTIPDAALKQLRARQRIG